MTTNDIDRFGLREAVEQAGDSIVITAVDGTILFVNPAFTVMRSVGRQRSLMDTAVKRG